MFGEAASDETNLQIPEKLFFRIGEVSELLGVEPHVLRYWETEFPSVAPKKSESGQRLYRRKDVETLARIKDLLYSRRYTIEGARQMLRRRAGQRRERPKQESLFEGDPLPEIRRELAAILEILR
ncbi:MAG: MerR family transcriptional regulator [Acidobacteria bacterium]|nr:MerR family transcriptional regulator [Acidobacteriota bacterium]